MSKMKKSRDLYIDMDGVLVSMSMANRTPYPQLVPDAMKFLEWAIKRFHCHYLTCWAEEEIHKAFPMLPKFHYAKWDVKNEFDSSKTNGINFDYSFIWLEDGATTKELDILKREELLDSYYCIDPSDDYALTEFMKKYEEDVEA